MRDHGAQGHGALMEWFGGVKDEGYSYPENCDEKTPAVYISGPMRGYEDFNFKAFDAAKRQLLDAGLIVFSPADLDRAQPLPADAPIDEYFDRDFAVIRHMQPGRDMLFLLWNWENSKGAKAEASYAHVRGIKVVSPQEWGCPGQVVEFTNPRKPDVLGALEPATTVAENAEAVRKDLPTMSGGEVRVIDPKTGGAKGVKLARFDLMPAQFLWELAECYGRGAKKYDDNNWRKGYAWSLTIGALQRHLSLWLRGATRDEDGNHHLAQVAWHAATLFTFQHFGLGTDDRPEAAQC